jgi:hypothetical protein
MRRRAADEGGVGRPDTGVLYSVDDVARAAHVPKVVVIRMCLAGRMPEWAEVDGRRYWTRARAVEAVFRLAGPSPTRDAA